MANSLTTAAQLSTTDTQCTKCRFCGKKGLLILPLRYGTAPQKVGAPTLPSHCGGKSVCDLPLKKSTYVLRTIRDGYLYVLVNRKGDLRWQAYAASGDGYLAEFPPLYPPLEPPTFTCEPNQCGRNASMVAIERAEDVTSAFLMFSPVAITPARLGEITGLSAAADLCSKGLMVRFSPADWAAGKRKQSHCLRETELANSVVEFALFEQGAKLFGSPLAKAMFNAAFPPMVRAPDESMPAMPVGAAGLGRLGSVRHYMSQNSALAVAVPDPIGIAQELNDHRNDPLNAIENLNLMPAPSGGTNRERFNVLQNLKEIQKNFEEGTIRARTQYKDELRDEIRAKYEPIFPDDSDVLRRRKRRWLARTDPRAKPQTHPNRHQWAVESESNRKKVAQIQKEIAEIDQSYPESWSKDGARKEWVEKYESRLDRAAMDAFEKTYADLADKAMTLATERADDHLKWVRDERLIVAFDTLYDKANAASGRNFQYQAAMCTAGMTGVKVCELQFDAWAHAPSIERDNLYMRGLVMNQEVLRLAANEAFKAAAAATAQAKSPADIDGHALYRAFKGLASALKASDSAWDEYARDTKNQLAGMHARWEGQKLFQISEFTKSVCRAGIGKTEMAVVGRLGGLLHMWTGAIGESIRFNELMYKIDPEVPPKPKTKGNVPTTSLEEAKRNSSTGMDPTEARRIAAADVAKGKSLPTDLIADAAEKREKYLQGVRLRVDEAVEKTRAKGSTETNNYHQVRMGMALAGLETINLFFYMKELREKGYANSEESLKALASGMSMSAMIIDAAYAHTKSVREKASGTALKGAGDILRGGFKFFAGGLATGAGLIGVWMEGAKLWTEFQGDRREGAILIGAIKLLSSGASTVFGAIAAFSYAAPTLQNLALKTSEKSIGNWVLSGMARGAEKLAERVALLRWVARFNWIGIAVLVVEFGHWAWLRLQPGAFEIWCGRSQFANKSKAGVRYSSTGEELQALAMAVKLEGL